MARTHSNSAARLRRKKHTKKVIRGTPDRPRMSVFRSGKHIYAQIIDDETGRTLAAASSLKLAAGDGVHGGNRAGAARVGQAIAEAALAKDVDKVVFDRNGYLYHGRVAALADAAREAGMKF